MSALTSLQASLLTVKLPDGEQFNTHVENVDAQSNPVYIIIRPIQMSNTIKDRRLHTLRHSALQIRSRKLEHAGHRSQVLQMLSPTKTHLLNGIASRVSASMANLALCIYIKRQGSKAVKVLRKAIRNLLK